MRCTILPFILLPTLIWQETHESNADEYKVSAGETEEVIRVLEKVRDGYRASNSAMENILIKGRASRVTVRARPDISIDNASARIKPNWQPFTLVERNGNKRWEQGYDHVTGASSQNVMIHRLINPDGMYKLDIDLLAVSGLESVELTWPDYANWYFRHLLVRDHSTFSRIDVMCQNFIDRIKGRLDSMNGVPYLKLMGVDIAVYESASEISIAIERPEPVYLVRVVVDPRQGFNVVSEFEKDGTLSDPLFTYTDRKVEFNEVADGVFFPKTATAIAATLGSASEKQNRDGWVRYDLEVTSSEFGDFEFDDTLFTVESLPVPRGATVVDNRTVPPNSFTFGEPPFSEEALRLAISAGPPVSSFRTWLVWLNVAIVFALCIFVVRKHIRHA